MIKEKKPVILLILDGWGYAHDWGGNALSIANTPNFDRLWREYPHCLLGASGTSVGLPGHERGNSEVGHLNLGSGRIPYQDSRKIQESIDNRSFFSNKALLNAVNHAKENKSNLHIMALMSDGNIHCNINHIYAFLELLKQESFTSVYLHCFTDGRDTPPMSALHYISELEGKLKTLGFGQIATISGRFWGMDRDNHWDRTQAVYSAMVESKGQFSSSALSSISQSYNSGKTDEFIFPTVITDNGKPITKVQDGDSVVFFNFRSDRARQITMAFAAEKFQYFKRKKISNLYFVGLIPYGFEEELKLKIESVFAQDNISNTIAEILSKNDLNQFHIAETEKYAHITYFFNGGKETPFPREDRLLIPSPRVISYDLAPEMSVKEITKNLVGRIEKKDYNFIVANFANTDMVGHTGNFKAAVKACEEVDWCLGEFAKAVIKSNSTSIITADHGNIEEMIDPKTGEIDTEHTTNPVPCILYNNGMVKLKEGILSDVSPTILEIMKIDKPSDMTGTSLINY